MLRTHARTHARTHTHSDMRTPVSARPLRYKKIINNQYSFLDLSCHLLVHQRHFVLVALTTYHIHNHYYIAVLSHDLTTCPSMHWVRSPPQRFVLDSECHYHCHRHSSPLQTGFLQSLLPTPPPRISIIRRITSSAVKCRTAILARRSDTR